MDSYTLPEAAVLGGERYSMDTDFRLGLRLLQYLEDSPLPEILRWRVAIRAFFREPVPAALEGEAMEYLARFLSGGKEAGRPGPKLLTGSWTHLPLLPGSTGWRGWRCGACPGSITSKI